MKRFFHKITALFLSLLVLVSTTSFAVDMHFCGNHLVDMTLLGEAESCAMEKATQAWSGCEEAAKSWCCSDETILIEGQDDIHSTFDTLDVGTAVFAIVERSVAPVFLIISVGRDVPKEVHPPPLLVYDYQVLYEQYLI